MAAKQPSWISNQNDFSFFLIYKSPRYSLSSFQSIGLSVQEKTSKIDFQDGDCSSHIGFPIRTILAISDLQVSQIFPTKFQVDWHFGSAKDVQNGFSRWRLWRPSWISNSNNFSYFGSENHSDTSNQVSSLLVSVHEQYIFSRWQLWRPSWISNQNNFSYMYFWSTNCPDTSYKFCFNWPFSSGEVQNRFSRWPPWWPSKISDLNDFIYFWYTSCPDTSYQVLSPLAFQFRRSSSK